MNCADTLGVICSCLQRRELAAVGNVSRACRAAVTRFMSERERRYYANACLREDLVDLVPPSQILALRFLEDERKLLVLVRINSPMLGEGIECCLYVQEALPEGIRSDHGIDLPIQFALSTSHVHFEGNRFLCCTTREGALTVFDCIAEALLELPFGYDGFHASPNGRRCLVDYNRHLYYCCSDTNITLSWARGKGGADSSTVAPKLRANLSIDNPLLTYPLGNSSSAWRSFWVGQSSVLYAHEQGVVLLKERIAPAAGRSASTLSCSKQPRREEKPPLLLSATTSTTFETVELGQLSKLSSTLAHSSSSTVSNVNGGCDEYVILNCQDSTLYSILVALPHGQRRGSELATSTGLEDQGVKISEMSLASLIPARSCIIKEVLVAVPAATYAVFLNDHSEDRLLLVSADMTLSRWITIGEPSALTLLVSDGIVITASLPNAATRDHPMLQSIEGGVGSVFSFSDEFCPDILDPTLTSIKVASSLTALRAEGGAPGSVPWYKVSIQSFNGVEFLSWAALGVVSASLVWTITALVSNGWWLHLQLLFCGKVN